MLKALIDALIITGLLFFFEKRNKAASLDMTSIFLMLLATVLCVFLLNALFAFLELANYLSMISYLLYFLIPFIMLKTSHEYTTQRSMAYGGVFIIVTVVTELVLIYLLT